MKRDLSIRRPAQEGGDLKVLIIESGRLWMIFGSRHNRLAIFASIVIALGFFAAPAKQVREPCRAVGNWFCKSSISADGVAAFPALAAAWAIQQITGDCIMPREGVFCRVIRGGRIAPGAAAAAGAAPRRKGWVSPRRCGHRPPS